MRPHKSENCLMKHPRLNRSEALWGNSLPQTRIMRAWNTETLVGVVRYLRRRDQGEAERDYLICIKLHKMNTSSFSTFLSFLIFPQKKGKTFIFIFRAYNFFFSSAECSHFFSCLKSLQNNSTISFTTWWLVGNTGSVPWSGFFVCGTERGAVDDTHTLFCKY